MLVLATRWPRAESGLWCSVCVCVCVCVCVVLGCGMSTLLQLPALFTSKKIGLHGFEGREFAFQKHFWSLVKSLPVPLSDPV